MKDTSKDEIRGYVIITSLFVGIAMAILSLWLSFDEASRLGLKTEVLLAMMTGLPLATSFYQSVGRESVGGLPCSCVVAIGVITSVVLELHISWGWGFFSLIVFGFILIGVQCFCNKRSESSH